MREYVRYELQIRKWSANAVLGIYEITDENGKTKEKSDMVLVSCLNKVDGDVYAQNAMDTLNEKLSLDIFEKLRNVGFLCEIVTDAWANWEFVDDKPDYSTAVPLYKDTKRYRDIHNVCWRGLYWYFDNNGKLHRDDIGCYRSFKSAVKELVKYYESIKEEVDMDGFNNPYLMLPQKLHNANKNIDGKIK